MFNKCYIDIAEKMPGINLKQIGNLLKTSLDVKAINETIKSYENNPGSIAI